MLQSFAPHPLKHVCRAAALSLLLLTAACATPQGGGLSPTPAAADLRVGINTRPAFYARLSSPTAQPLLQGENMQLVLESGVTGFGHLYLLRASGSGVVLAENIALEPWLPRAFPQARDAIDLRAAPPAGLDTVLLVVTRTPFSVGGPQAAEQAPLLLGRLQTGLSRLHPDDWVGAPLMAQILTRR